jgi:HD superfamily phosphohydrolase
MKKTRRIRTVLYDDQRIEATELDLLHTPSLQRLYDLHQLGLTDRVFIDASHSRLHHVVGVIEQVEKLVDAVSQNLMSNPDRVLAYADGALPRYASEWAEYVSKRRPAVRLMGLLHDLTHSPFGHTLEDEIQLLPTKHDEPDRQASAFFRLLCQWIFWLIRDAGHEEAVQGTWGATSREATAADGPNVLLARYLDAPDLLAPPETDACVELMASLATKHLTKDTAARHASREPRAKELCQFLHDLCYAMRALLYLDCSQKPRPKPNQVPSFPGGSYTFEKLIRAILDSAESPLSDEDDFCPHRDAFLLDIIGNTICADLLDYAKRDCHLAGLKLDYDSDRIVENFTLVSHEADDVEGPFKGRSVRTAISLFSHKLRIDAPGELLNLLQIRFYLHQRVLFHPTKCIAGAMLGGALQHIGWKKLPEHLTYVGDPVFLHQVSEAARIARDMLMKHRGSATTLTTALFESLSKPLDAVPLTGVIVAAKQLLRDRIEEPIKSILEDLRAGIRLLDRLSARRYYRPMFRVLPSHNPQNIDAEQIANIFRNPGNRFRTERAIERAANLPAGTIVIHCPNSEGPRKIAAMLIAMDPDSQAHKLRDIEKLNPALFQKHQEAVRALEEMYASMWRLVVAIAPPFRSDFERINKHIGHVLNAEITEKVLGHRQEREWANDPLMERELELAAGPAVESEEVSRPDIEVQDRRARSPSEKGRRPQPAMSADLFAGAAADVAPSEWAPETFELPPDVGHANRVSFEASRANLINALEKLGSSDNEATVDRAKTVWLHLRDEWLLRAAARKEDQSPISEEEWLKALRAKEGF